MSVRKIWCWSRLSCMIVGEDRAQEKCVQYLESRGSNGRDTRWSVIHFLGLGQPRALHYSRNSVCSCVWLCCSSCSFSKSWARHSGSPQGKNTRCRSLELSWQKIHIPARPCGFQFVFVSSGGSSWVLVFPWFLLLCNEIWPSWPTPICAWPAEPDTAVLHRLLHRLSLWFGVRDVSRGLQLPPSGGFFCQHLPQLSLNPIRNLSPHISHCGPGSPIKPWYMYWCHEWLLTSGFQVWLIQCVLSRSSPLSCRLSWGHEKGITSSRRTFKVWYA